MPAGLTNVIVVNSALEQIASQTRISALTENSSAAIYASVVYAPTVQLMLREIEPDFARLTVALTVAAGGVPLSPWAFEYLYPADCVRLRQVRPSTYDVNDPQPVRANVAFDLIGNPPVKTKVIYTNQAAALGVYTTSLVDETAWDSVFTDAVIRRLANPLAMALSGRPEFAKTILEQSALMAQSADMMDDSGFRRGLGGS